VSFGFDLPVAESPAPQAAQPVQRPRSTPNTAVKRSRPRIDVASKTAGTSDAAAPAALTSTAKRKRDIYDIPDDTSEERIRPREILSARGSVGRLSALRIPKEGHNDVATSATQPASQLNARGAKNDPIVAEEVSESPIEAPGSGQRRSVRLSEVEQSARRLQSVLGREHDVTLPASSPSLRKTVGVRGQSRQSAPKRSMRSPRNSLEHKEGIDELSPDVEPSIRQSVGAISSSHNEKGVDELSPVPVSRRLRAQTKSMLGPGRQRKIRQEKTQPVQDPEHARQNVDGDDEAGWPVRRRPRRSSPVASVDLSSRPLALSSMPQHRHRRGLGSPAQQRQPKKRKAIKPPRKSTAAEQVPTASAPEATGFHVNVQRFTRKFHVSEDEEGSGPDVLQLDIPFANRSGVNSVDLLAQLLEDIISTQRDVLQNKAANAEDRARKREFVTMLKALEAFRTELSTRLLEHVSCRLGRSHFSGLADTKIDHRIGYGIRIEQAGESSTEGKGDSARGDLATACRTRTGCSADGCSEAKART
jgi:hypothetical protein